MPARFEPMRELLEAGRDQLLKQSCDTEVPMWQVSACLPVIGSACPIDSVVGPPHIPNSS